MYKQHSEVVRECGQYGLVCFEKNISNGDRAVTQEAKLPLRVELLQKDKTMIGQLHASTYTERARDDSQLPVYYRPQCTKKRLSERGLLSCLLTWT